MNYYSQRGRLRDLIAFGKHLKERNRIFRRAPAKPLSAGPMNRLATALHPRAQHLRISEVREEYPGAVTFRLEPLDRNSRVAPFRAGQYIAVETAVRGNRVSRPYSIAASPDESRRGNYYDITVKRMSSGYVSTEGIAEWTVGTKLLCSEPEGFFYYESLRDATTLVCLAGGTGITPFRSIVPDVLKHEPAVKVYLYYGVNSREEELYPRFFQELAKEYGSRFAYRVIDDGVITARTIADAVDSVPSVFICGPEAMHDHLAEELKPLSLPRRRFRRENFGTSSTDADTVQESVTITVKPSARGDSIHRVPAVTGETVLTALERAGLNPPARCRSGECGWCRVKLYEGTVHVSGRNDGRRKADLKFSYFHPCSSYPTSDLEIGMVANPLQGENL